MTDIKEICTHIKSVERTLKITNAMYLISSSNPREACRQLTDVEPYFSKIEAAISSILHHSPEIGHRFFDRRPGIPPDKQGTGFIVITGDKRLTRTYDHNILKLAEGKVSRAANPSLFVVGQVGCSYSLKYGIPIGMESLYTAQDPNMGQARNIAELMLDLYLNSQLGEVCVLLTKMVGSFQMEPTVHRLLPLNPDVFPEYEKNRGSYNRDAVYIPLMRAVMDRLVPGYVKGGLSGALVEFYCSEQNTRMTAMKSSSDNVRAILQRLNLSFNRARQAATTQEIAEVAGGVQVAL